MCVVKSKPSSRHLPSTVDSVLYDSNDGFLDTGTFS